MGTNTYDLVKRNQTSNSSLWTTSPFVREMMKTWASSNKATPHNWFKLISVGLEEGPQLCWKCYWREEAKILEQQGKAKGFRFPKNKFLTKPLI